MHTHFYDDQSIPKYEEHITDSLEESLDRLVARMEPNNWTLGDIFLRILLPVDQRPGCPPEEGPQRGQTMWTHGIDVEKIVNVLELLQSQGSIDPKRGQDLAEGAETGLHRLTTWKQHALLPPEVYERMAYGYARLLIVANKLRQPILAEEGSWELHTESLLGWPPIFEDDE